ncbi:hypothetical protein ACFL1H_04500, partial [Nanoarchaeota archaeon]
FFPGWILDGDRFICGRWEKFGDCDPTYKEDIKDIYSMDEYINFSTGERYDDKDKLTFNYRKECPDGSVPEKIDVYQSDNPCTTDSDFQEMIYYCNDDNSYVVESTFNGWGQTILEFQGEPCR